MRASLQFLIALLLGLVVGLLVPAALDWHLRGLLGWNAGALTLLLLNWRVLLHETKHSGRPWAVLADPGPTEIWLLATSACFFSLFAAIVVLRRARDFPAEPALLWTLLALVGIALSWLLTHTAYALHYLHLHYDADPDSGLVFQGETSPCNRDFAYFSFTLGMCCQVSDVLVRGAGLRQTVLAHALLSFIYNTIVMAIILNLVMSFLA